MLKAIFGRKEGREQLQDSKPCNEPKWYVIRTASGTHEYRQVETDSDMVDMFEFMKEISHLNPDLPKQITYQQFRQRR